MLPAIPLRAQFAFLLGSLAVLSAHANLGETLSQLKTRLGKPQEQEQPRKDMAVWLFEVEDGQLIYSVTFNPQGRSIAEGLRPLKRAVFTKDTAQDFIQSQISAIRESKTLHTFKGGEKYQFAGQVFTCPPEEIAIVDDANGIMIIWVQKGVPSVMAVSGAMVQRTH